MEKAFDGTVCSARACRKCVARGFLHGGDDLVGSWIENEILARHE